MTLDDAVKAEMQQQGCRAIKGVDMDEGVYCTMNGCDWDTERNECSVVGAAVRAGYSAGRRAEPEPVTALDEVVKVEMTERECVRESWRKFNGGNPIEIHECHICGGLWDTERDLCGEVFRAVRAGYSAGRRAGIEEAAAGLDAAASRAMGATGYGFDGYGDEAYERAVNAARIAYGNAHAAVRSLLNEEASNDS